MVEVLCACVLQDYRDDIQQVTLHRYSSVATMITKLRGEQSDAPGECDAPSRPARRNGPPPPAPGSFRPAPKAGGTVGGPPCVTLNPNADESIPDGAVASQEQHDSRDELLKRLVDGQTQHEIDRQRFSLPPIRLVYDAFVAFYEELGVSPLCTAHFCSDALHFRCQQISPRHSTMMLTSSA